MLMAACNTPSPDPTAVFEPEGSEATLVGPQEICDPVPESEADSPGEVECIGVGGFTPIDVARGGSIRVELDGGWEFDPLDGVEMVRADERVWVLGPFNDSQFVSLRSTGAGGRVAHWELEVRVID
jgi:hypothetical protein